MLIYWKMSIFEKKTRLVHESHAVKPTKKKKTSPPVTIPPFLLLLFNTKFLFQKQNEEKVMEKTTNISIST